MDLTSNILILYYFRNAFLASKGYSGPTARKTGTTIVGAIFADGVVLGADTRATDDTIVAEKNCQKIHYMAKNIYCCGAGEEQPKLNTSF